jgi:DNA polymerase-3 subunit beta
MSLMKLSLDRGVLLKSLGHVQSVVERRNTIPILSNVLIEATDGRMTLTATDLDIAVVEAVEAEIAQPGATTAPAHPLYEIVRKLPDGVQVELRLDAERGRMAIVAGRSRFTLACLPREDFPAASADEMPHRFEIEAGELARLIDKTRFAISTEETRYYLNGIYLHAADSNQVSMLRAVATDGHRLASAELPVPHGAERIPGIIIPRKTVAELRKLIDEVEGSVTIGLSETKIRFAFGHVTLTSKLIDGTFPDYARVIPTVNDKVLEVEGKSFAEAIDRVATISTEKSRAVKLNLDRDRLIVSVTSPENGSAQEELPVSYGAEPLEIGFNARYLLDIASQINGESARFLLSDAHSPTLVRDCGDDHALYVLMPMRV